MMTLVSDGSFFTLTEILEPRYRYVPCRLYYYSSNLYFNKTANFEIVSIRSRVKVIMGGFFSTPTSKITNFHQLRALDIDKKEVDFAALEGKVVLVSNVASK